MKIIRLLVSVAMLGALAFAAPVARADHEGTAGTGWPDGGGHEPEAVAPAEPDPTTATSTCSVTGSVTTSTYQGASVEGNSVPVIDGPGPQHSVSSPGLNNNPSHTHYTFNELVLQCVALQPGGVDGALAVVSSGGNDGHIPVLPEDDANGDGAHDANSHHGSVNLSAWSNSSGYTAPCAEAGAHTNKADIRGTLGADIAEGWVKYNRLANYVLAWGEFLCGSGPGVGTSFWSDLILSPDTSIADDGAFAIHGTALIYGP